MDTNLQEFIRLIRQSGVARSNRFDVGFFLPASLREIVNRIEGDSRFDQLNGGLGGGMKQSKPLSGGVGMSRHMSIVAKSINDPGVTFNTNDTNLGYKRKMVYDEQQADLELVFICTGDMFEKRLFAEWSKLMVDGRHRIAYYDDYVTDLSLSVQKPDGTETGYTLNIKEAFPIAVGQLQLDRSEVNNFLILPVTFTYRKLELEDQQAEVGTVTTTTEVPGPLDQYESPQLALPEAPADLEGSASGNDLYRSINAVSDEVSKGMDPKDGVKVIERYVQGVQASGSVSQTDKEKISTYGEQVVNVLRGT